MKQHLYDWHTALEGLSTHRRYVLEKLIHYANGSTFETSVTVERLHAHVGGGERNIQTALAELRDAGLIQDTGRKSIGPKGGRVTIYRVAPELDLDAGSAPSPAPSARKLVRHHRKEEEKTISKEIRLEEVRNELPDEINAAFIRYFGEPAFKSYLKDAKWDVATRTVTVRLGATAKKLNADFRGFLAHWKIKVVVRSMELACA